MDSLTRMLRDMQNTHKLGDPCLNNSGTELYLHSEFIELGGKQAVVNKILPLVILDAYMSLIQIKLFAGFEPSKLY